MSAISAYFWWHYVKAFLSILHIWGNFIIFAYHYFSVSLLIQTLFAPWRKETVRALHIFPLSTFIEALTFNAVSRIIGFIVRIVTLSLAAVTLVIIVVAGLPFALIWLTSPGLTLPLYLWISRPTPLVRIQKKTATMKELFDSLFSLPGGQFVVKRLLLISDSLRDFSSTALDAAVPDSLDELTKLSEAFYLLASSWQPFRDFLSQRAITPEDLRSTSQWYERRKEKIDRSHRFWELSQLGKIPSIGASWAYGYTINVERYAHPLTIDENPLGDVVGRENELTAIEEILAKKMHNNVMLIGESGVGKLPILEMLGSRLSSGAVYPALRHKRLLSLSVPTILKDGGGQNRAKGLVHTILKEAADSGNIILVITDIDRIICPSEGFADLTEELLDVLSSGGMQIIGTVSKQRYHACVTANSALHPYFDTVFIEEPDRESIMTTLQTMAEIFETRQRVFVTYQALKEILTTTAHLFPDIPYPEKAINVLDKTLAHAKNVGETTLILPRHVDEVVAREGRVPLGSIEPNEQEKLRNLESTLHEQVVDQDEAIKTISDAMRRGRLGLKEKTKPIGSFLFLGPTGVGKTATAKALAHIYFEQTDTLIRFDMSTFQTAESITRLIGSSSGEVGLLVSAIKEKPYAVLLLDEFEKASPKIQNIFLTIFDEGYFLDVVGKKILCDNLIIIATSNAGAEFIREQLTASTSVSAEKLSSVLVGYILEHGIFTPELVNRFDAVVVYKPLTPEHLWAIARLELASLNKRLKDQYDVTVAITDELVLQLVTEGYTPEFGARPMQRVIQERVEDVIAQKMLANEVKRGETMTISL